ncbi:hypothetical protein B9Z65_2289 [Elsinoe australis]|uniref:Uncharacterized protein n=1 Tax=Elsinoe australis TaxID=40998 RepID=A0A2P7ZAA8_9PEZI|nr:hypothetical protein B9Z65_2289 [Elsinoe australis]
MSNVNNIRDYASSTSGTALELLALHIVVLSTQLILWYLTHPSSRIDPARDPSAPAKQASDSNRLGGPNKMEDDLINSKENKVETNSADEVAGREGKGLAGADKLGGVKDKVSEGINKLPGLQGKNY